MMRPMTINAGLSMLASTIQRIKQLKRHQVAQIILATLLLILTFRVVRGLLLVRELKSTAREMREQASALRSADNASAAVEALQDDLHHSHELVVQLKRTIWPFGGVMRQLDWMPVVGPDAAAAPDILDTLDYTLSAAESLQSTFDPLMQQMADDNASSDEALGQIITLIQADNGGLTQARADLEMAYAARQRITDTTRLSASLRDPLNDLDRVMVVLDQALSVTEVAPALLGADEPHHILVLVQNADELRATGGFITSSIYVVIDKGEIVSVTTLNSNSPEIDHMDQIDYEQPPDPLLVYMDLPLWLFRDANWSPDFPSSARRAADLYTFGRGVPVDTVVAISQYTAADLIRAVGGVPLPDGTTMTGDNSITMFQDLWTAYTQEEGFDSRKDFIGDLGPRLLDRLITSDINGLVQRLVVLSRTADQGQILLYSNDPGIQGFSERMGWDGALGTASGDTIYVVDSNVGYNKTDLNVARSLNYHLNLTAPSTPFAVLQVEYQNNSPTPRDACGGWDQQTYVARADDCYIDYVRFYLPPHAEMIQPPAFALPAAYTRDVDPSAGQVVPIGEERDRAAFGGLMVVLPGETVSASLGYQVPPADIFTRTSDGTFHYNLSIQKQPGTQPYPATVTIDLAPQMQVIAVSPAPSYQDAQTLYFETEMATDFRIHVQMQLEPDLAANLALLLPEAAVAENITPAPRIIATAPPLPTIAATPTPTPTHAVTPEVLASFPAVAPDGGYLRSGPHLGFPTIDRINPGMTVEVLARDRDPNWLWVLLPNGSIGWAFTGLFEGLPDLDDIPQFSPGYTPEPFSLTPFATVGPTATGGVPASLKARTNLREGPGVFYRVVGVLEEGFTVQILGRNNDASWLYIETAQARRGWVSVDLLSAQINFTTIPTIAAPSIPAPPITATTQPMPSPTSSVLQFTVRAGGSQQCQEIRFTVAGAFPQPSTPFEAFDLALATSRPEQPTYRVNFTPSSSVDLKIAGSLIAHGCTSGANSTCAGAAGLLCGAAPANLAAGSFSEPFSILLGIQSFDQFFPYDNARFDATVEFRVSGP